MKFIVLFISMILISSCSENASAKDIFEYDLITTDRLKVRGHLVKLMKIRNLLIKRYLEYHNTLWEHEKYQPFTVEDNHKFAVLLRDQEQAMYRYHRLSPQYEN